LFLFYLSDQIFHLKHFQVLPLQFERRGSSCRLIILTLISVIKGY
jgi:hypothetical protein